MIHPSRFSGKSNEATKTKRLKNKKSNHRGQWVFAGVITILVFGIILGRFGLFLVQGLPSIQNQNTYSIKTNPKDRTNILLTQINDKEATVIAILSVSSGDSNKLLVFDPNVIASLARQKGNYRLAAAWKIGDLEKSGTGATLLRDSVSRFLAIPIDKMVVVTPSGWESLKSKFGSTPESANASLSGKGFLLNLLTTTVPDGVSGDISFLKLSQLNLSSGHTLHQLSLSTQPGTAEVSFNDVDQLISANFAESSIIRLHPKVSLINSSGVAGAATEMARYIHNLGGEVINTDTATVVSQSQILDHLGGSKLSQRLFPLIGALVTSDRKPTRADIEIIIGQNAKDIF